MTHAFRFVATVAVLVALALCVPVQAQTPEIDEARLRAEAGDAEAQYTIGLTYDMGVPQDDAEAVRWYRLAADQGFARAQYRLGTMYLRGFGVPQDDAEGVRWYRLAADQSYVPALTNLGNMYETGEGVAQDYVQAYMWYDLAASQLCCQMLQRAIEHRYRVGGLMNSTQVAEARRLAREWDAAHPREP